MAELTHPDKLALVAILIRWSLADAVGVPQFFKGLVGKADFPQPIINKGVGGYVDDAEYNAWRLLNFAGAIGTNPKDKNAALATVLLPLLPKAGVEDATFLASLMLARKLVSSPATNEELRTRYQVPLPPASLGLADMDIPTGPAVRWTEETEDLVLQSWFTPDPAWEDVATLMKACTRARSVCRVELATGNQGTGVLIARDLVLTNYHVLGVTLAAPPETLAANAGQTLLRFGALQSEGPAAKGQEVRLHPDKPVLDCSPKHDFVLLRTDDSVAAAMDVQPFGTLGATPAPRSPLYVLQHPEGGVMKLALSTSGVSWVDPDGVTVQYTTKAARGSSGSPCFDGAWNLVALHHAGARAKGEGMLLGAIFDRIKPFLDA